MRFLDCTMRDGGNVVGNGFDRELTVMMLNGLIDNGITEIEMGNPKGIGAYEVDNVIAPLTDEEYLDAVQPFLAKGAIIGMFLNAKRYRQKYVELAASKGLKFLRVGANAGEGTKISLEPIREVKKNGMMAYYSLMKAYVSTPKELAEEAKALEDAGLDAITIMDSAGTMVPEEVTEYTETVTKAVKIPVGFHCHNNLGMSAANAVAAWKAGAKILDGGLLGMARSAGNLATEVGIAIMQRYGEYKDVNLYGLLEFLDNELIPAMEKHDYHVAIKPLDLVLGMSGCHSSFVKKFKKVAQEEGVSLYRLIADVSAIDRGNPSDELMHKVAADLKK
ncbi:MAG: 4-hydroxy-2-oxovalerate aldolase [Synergistaceae bacterium]|nr:4-hydroxy-2-oxovalerate aldolase [Synergistaceae bacterium]